MLRAHLAYCVALWPLSAGSNLLITPYSHSTRSSSLAETTIRSAMRVALKLPVTVRASKVMNAGTTIRLGGCSREPRACWMYLGAEEAFDRIDS